MCINSAKSVNLHFRLWHKCFEKNKHTSYTSKCNTRCECSVCVCVWEKKRTFRSICNNSHIVQLFLGFGWIYHFGRKYDERQKRYQISIRPCVCVLSSFIASLCVYTLNSGNTSILCNKHRLFYPLHLQLNILRFPHSGSLFSEIWIFQAKCLWTKNHIYQQKNLFETWFYAHVTEFIRCSNNLYVYWALLTVCKRCQTHSTLILNIEISHADGECLC